MKTIFYFGLAYANARTIAYTAYSFFLYSDHAHCNELQASIIV